MENLLTSGKMKLLKVQDNLVIYQISYCILSSFVIAVIFHVATLMPNMESDHHYSNKKLHIGNNFVTIVYNNSGKSYQFGTIKVTSYIMPYTFDLNIIMMLIGTVQLHRGYCRATGYGS